jgi:hypothetical protein
VCLKNKLKTSGLGVRRRMGLWFSRESKDSDEDCNTQGPLGDRFANSQSDRPNAPGPGNPGKKAQVKKLDEQQKLKLNKRDGTYTILVSLHPPGHPMMRWMLCPASSETTLLDTSQEG